MLGISVNTIRKLVPIGFGYSYIIPLLKYNDYISKLMTREDFRGIVISPVISKLLNIALWRRAVNLFPLKISNSPLKWVRDSHPVLVILCYPCPSRIETDSLDTRINDTCLRIHGTGES